MTRLVVVLVVVLGVALAGCSEPASYSAPEREPLGTPSAHPCDVVSDEEAADLLGVEAVTGEEIDNADLAGGESIATCQYLRADPAEPGLTLQTSATDDFDGLLAMFSGGGDDLAEVRVAGAEASALVVDENDVVDIYTVVALARGEVHLAVVDAPTRARAVRIATGAVELLVAGP